MELGEPPQVGHVDALRILDQAGTKPVPGAAYGVWASRSRSSGIAARRNGDRWILDGTLRFASGAGVVDRALVPVWPSRDVHVLLDLEVRDWTFDTEVWRTRAYGDFWSYCLLAEGAVDIACEPELSLHDMAALVPVVEEAGGRFTSLEGEPGPFGGNALATNGLLHDEVLGLLATGS